MSLYVYCTRWNDGVLELAKALDAHRLRKFDGIDFWNRQKRCELKEGDIVVCWGANIPEPDGIRVLNSLEVPLTKFEEWKKLVRANVPTVLIGRGNPTSTSTLQPRLSLVLQTVDHDYCVQQENFATEFRLHSFCKRSIRAGVKVPQEGFTFCTESEWKPGSNLVHPWVRSYKGGWRVNYDMFKSTPPMRALAHKAVATLGLTFGAVDMGQRSDGILKVLEVDPSPIIEGGTVQSYVCAINRWVKEGKYDTRGVRAGEPRPSIEDEELGDPGDL